MLREGRPTTPEAVANDVDGIETFSGNRGLRIHEPLIFENGSYNRTGVDMEDVGAFETSLGGMDREESDINLPGYSEPETMRHFTRLSRKNYAIDMGFYPLGSCTMKHNPRLNEKMARVPGLADVHPLQPISTVQGSLKVMDELSHWLKTLTGMPAVALSPKAGAHGELCGVMAIRAAHEAKGDPREYILVPESAHGTNPATAALCGYKVKAIPANDEGRVDLEALKAELNETVAGIMLTNPNTCGLFERDIIDIAEAVHAIGAYFYCDGANFNAIVGRVRPGDLGIDCMHINLHKTFSTPHGGGGPGSGPVVFSDRLADYVPVPDLVMLDDNSLSLKEHVEAGDDNFGRMTAFHGQMGMYLRALSYMMSHGSDGLRQVAEDAVLSANYLQASLEDLMTRAFDGPCMHECLFSDKFLKDTGVETLDFAKAMIDEGYHPMTMYFPLVVHGAMLIEPTETESKHELDNFIHSMRGLATAAKEGDVDRFKGAPYFAPLRRLDETAAARKPILKWQASEAAE